MTKDEMIAGLTRGRSLTQEEWSDPAEIRAVNELLDEGRAVLEEDWSFRDEVQCQRRVIRGRPMQFGYTNWRGEYAVRHAIPIAFEFGATEWHPEPQWLLRAFDLDKQAERQFAVEDMGTARRDLDTVRAKAKTVIDRATFDDSGVAGKGGNGGLLSRETIRAVDELRHALNQLDLSYAERKRSR